LRYEYREGAAARRNFEKAMKAIFKAPKGKRVAKRDVGVSKKKNVSDKERE
jgi:hypothetical protein